MLEWTMIKPIWHRRILHPSIHKARYISISLTKKGPLSVVYMCAGREAHRNGGLAVDHIVCSLPLPFRATGIVHWSPSDTTLPPIYIHTLQAPKTHLILTPRTTPQAFALPYAAPRWSDASARACRRCAAFSLPPPPDLPVLPLPACLCPRQST